VCPKWFSWYIRRKPCTYLAPKLTLSQNGLKRASTWPMSPTNTIGCVKIIFEPLVRSLQTVHPSCAETNTISKQTKISFHLTYISEEYHQVCPKPFPCPWYIRCKSCTYLALRLKLCPNGSKWAFSWSTSPRSTIRCVKNDLWAYGMFDTNRAPNLCVD
jgi:hypothetical protein